MLERYRQPRWALLYLVLPLAAVLLWLVQRAHLSGIEHGLLDMGVLLVVAGYVEAWRFANLVALLHHPLAGTDGSPIYYVREVTAPGVPGSEAGGVSLPAIGGVYSDLFSLPVRVAEPSPSAVDASPGAQEVG